MAQHRRNRLAIVAGLAAALSGAHATMLRAQASPLAKEVRTELAGLPSYGVFDLITFDVSDSGVVTLAGYVVSPRLKMEAEGTVSEVKGVTLVNSQIELAPVNATDDELRRRLFRAIYRDPFLAHYGTGANQAATARAGFAPWGDNFRDFTDIGTRARYRPYMGHEPVGNYAIHILIRASVVTLAGQVATEADKASVGEKARLVTGVVAVNNDLHVDGGRK